jgi:hypothetical protein
MDDKHRSAKAHPGDKLVPQNCDSCEFNFGEVCAGYGKRTDNGKPTYGMPMEEAQKMFPEGCEDWGISLDSFIEQEKLNGR